MSESGERPEVVAVPTEQPAPPQPRLRRAASLRVREARDRLTSTSGTRPAFDHELLRQYAQTRLSASLVVILLVVVAGLLSSLWVRPLLAGIWTAVMLVVHALMITHCRRFLTEPASPAATRRWRTRFILLDLLFGAAWTFILIHPSGFDTVSNTLIVFLMLL